MLILLFYVKTQNRKVDICPGSLHRRDKSLPEVNLFTLNMKQVCKLKKYILYSFLNVGLKFKIFQGKQ